MWALLGQGILLGVSAGVSPGPLFALVIAETLHHGTKAGLRVALVPLITDMPIVLVTVFVLSRLASFAPLLGVISFLGCIVVSQMAYESIRTRPFDPDLPVQKPKSLRKGIIVNALSPHPYLFWFTVGAPIILKSSIRGLFVPCLFIGGFYTSLITSKVILAIITGQSRVFLNGPLYIYLMRFLGLLLFFFAIMLFCDGLHFVGLL